MPKNKTPTTPKSKPKAAISKKRRLDDDDRSDEEAQAASNRATTEDSPFKKSQIQLYQSTARKTVFDMDSSSCYDVLLSHGIKPAYCLAFKDVGVDGQTLEQWGSKFGNHLDLRKHLEQTCLKSMNLSENEARHLYAIAERYKKNPHRPKAKIICDSVHGQVQLHPLLIKIIDTPQFQRLRFVKQLGSLNYIYPCAVHTRFEHCIGTSHIAGMLVLHLKENQPSLDINLSDELCVRIAGLCHDLGHGPFSHLFEEAMEKMGVSAWKHEMASLDIFDMMLNENPELEQEFASFGLFQIDFQFIKDLIYNRDLKKARDMDAYEAELSKLDSLKARGLSKSFLFEIVSNYRNGIDVDKFDYFGRDCSQMGFNNNFDFKRYINRTRVIKSHKSQITQICVRDKEISNIYEMYHVREYLTRRAYKHETASSINLMIVEALMKANQYFKFTEIVQKKDLNEYLKLNDNLFLQIRYSTDESLKDSRQIIECIETRKLFKYVGSTVISKQLDKFNNDPKNIETSFYDYAQKSAKAGLETDDIIVEIVRFNYGSSSNNPIENVRFYTKHEPDVSLSIKKEQVAEMLLTVFEDIVFRLYSKKSDAETISALSRLFFMWCQDNQFPEPLHVLSHKNYF